jgi:hypothetical protein
LLRGTEQLLNEIFGRNSSTGLSTSVTAPGGAYLIVVSGHLRSLQVRLDHIDDFIGGGYLSRSWALLSVKDVTANVTFQKLSHEAVHRPSGRAHDLQNLRTIALLGKGSYQSFDLPLNAFGPQN